MAAATATYNPCHLCIILELAIIDSRSSHCSTVMLFEKSITVVFCKYVFIYFFIHFDLISWISIDECYRNVRLAEMSYPLLIYYSTLQLRIELCLY